MYDDVLCSAVLEQAEDGAADATDDVGKMRDVAGAEQSGQNLLREVHGDDRHEGQRDLTGFAAGGRGEEDKHIDNAAGAKEHAAAIKENVEQAGDQRRDGKHEEQPPAAVALLYDGAKGEDERHIGHEMGKRGMPKHMTEKAYIGHGAEETGAVHAENGARGSAACQRIKSERNQRENCKAEHRRCVKSKDDLAFFHKMYSCIVDGNR